LASYLSSYDSTRCTAVDTFEYAFANYGSFIKTADENHTYFLVDGENAAIQYRYRSRREVLTYESHMPRQHLGAMFTDVRDGVSYQLVRRPRPLFLSLSTLPAHNTPRPQHDTLASRRVCRLPASQAAWPVQRRGARGARMQTGKHTLRTCDCAMVACC
jgi:hypothetical protein